MKRSLQLLLVIVLGLPTLAIAQFDLTIRVVDAEDKTPIPLANILIVGSLVGSATDADGFATLKGLTGSSVRIKITMLGYEPLEKTIALPTITPVILMLEHHHDELGEVTVSATRGSRLIDRVPTRVEVIAGEELEEKANMNSSNITMLLKETPGIQVQQTDASSANMSFRIQGLDGRYTQLLQDGMPIYGGLASSLSLAHIPRLNLKQVEIIKGSASTLYGGGAIAGLVNLVTKTYEDEGTTIMLNALSTSGADVNLFSAGKARSIGYTAFISGVAQNDYDVNGDSFADIPKTRRIHLEPTVWIPIDSYSTIKAGISYTNEVREGGYVGANSLTTKRTKYHVGMKSTPDELTTIEFKNVLSRTSMHNEGRTSFEINNDQTAIFSEASATIDNNRSKLMLGMSFQQEKFSSMTSSNPFRTKYAPDRVIGIFAQNVHDFNDKLVLETGLRFDLITRDQKFLMPRVNVLYKWNSRFTSRIGGGTGYKSSNSILQEYPIVVWNEALSGSRFNTRSDVTKPERSLGLNADLDYKTIIDENFTLSVNQMFFYTKINDPIFINDDHYRTVHFGDIAPFRTYQLSNRDGFLHSRGTETNVKLGYKQLKLLHFYTFTAVNANGSADQMKLTPKHRFGSVLMFEKHDSYRVGFEAYYTGSQQLSENRTSPPYMIYGFMAEKTWENISFFINFENLTNSRYDNLTPRQSDSNIVYDLGASEIFAPTDGRVINGGLKIRF